MKTIVQYMYRLLKKGDLSMTPEQKLAAKIIYFSIAYGTIFCYLVIVLLILANDLNSNYVIILLSFLIPAAFSIFFSTIILRKSLENESDVTLTIVKLAIAHVPTIFGLIAFFIQVNI